LLWYGIGLSGVAEVALKTQDPHMPTPDTEVENETDTQKAVRQLREALADIEEFEDQLDAAEEAAGLDQMPEMPAVERMGRLGCSEAACDRVAELLNSTSTLEKLSGQLQGFLAEQPTADRSADNQLAAVADQA
jgi:hypothetical protein